MKEFDYIILGGGCAGLSLAYELDVHQKLNDKTLAIVEPRTEYKRDKTWSFWKVSSHSLMTVLRKAGKSFLSKHPLILKLLNVIISLIKVLIVDSFTKR